MQFQDVSSELCPMTGQY